MIKVLIVYATDYGSPDKMAHAIASGLETLADTKTIILQAEAARHHGANVARLTAALKGVQVFAK